MKRRNFLTAVGAVALSPVLIRRAFAADADKSQRVEALFEAYREARRAGRPLLVLIVPSETDYVRGTAWGEYINHGTEWQLAPLAIFQPACATAAELAKLAPQANVEADTVIVALDTEQVPARTYSVSAALPVYESRSRRSRESYEAGEAKEAQIIEARIDALASAVETAADELWSAQNAKGFENMSRLWRLVPGTSVDLEDRSADLQHIEVHAGFYLRLRRHRDVKGAFKAALADIARARFRDERIPGSYWALGSGCGVQIEGGPPSRYACGMGHVNARSIRFLHFYVKPEDLREY